MNEPKNPASETPKVNSEKDTRGPHVVRNWLLIGLGVLVVVVLLYFLRLA